MYNYIRTCILCLAISVVVICLFAWEVMKKTLMESVKQGFVQNLSAIERHIDDYYYASYIIQNSRTVIEAMTTEATDDTEPYYAKRQIEAQLNMVTGTLSLYPITLYFDGTILYYDDISFRPVAELEKYSIFQEFRTSDQSYIWLPEEEIRYSNLNNTIKVFPFLRKIGDNKNPIAFQKINIRAKEIEDLITIDDDKTCTFLFSGMNETILLEKGNEDEVYDNTIFTKEQLEKCAETDVWTQISAGKNSIPIYAKKVKGTDWILVTVFRQKAMQPLYFGIIVIWSIMFLILTILYVLFDRKYSAYIVKRVKVLEKHMGNLLQEEFVPIQHSEMKEKDELDFLAEYYNETIEKMRNLMTKRLEDEKEKRKLEQSLMQAQINPHFLYNTLDMIKWKALDAGIPEISDIICRLSDFYKLSLNKGREIVTVEDEIDHIKNYIELQNCRFGTRIQIDIGLPDEIKKSRIPKITLQPLVENAIQHGFLANRKIDNQFIELYGWKEDQSVVLMLQDNGCGMSQETIQKILEKDTSSDVHGFGVYNICERIKLYCGEEYGLSFESSLEEGTTVYIRISSDL